MKSCILFTFFFVFAFSLKAQDWEYARKWIDTLSAPGLHGRGYVFGGDEIAAGLIKDAFEKWNLIPFGNSYFQPFSFSVNTFPGKAELSAEDKVLKPGIDFLVMPFSAPDSGSYPVVLFNSETLSKSRKLKAFEKTDFSDKYIVVDDAGIKDMEDREIFKAMLTNPYNAKGIIKLTDNKLTWSVSRKQVSFTGFEVLRNRFPLEAQTVSVNVESEFLNNYTSRNVAGYIRGISEPDSFIVFTAHYDHLGRMGKAVYFPGANDNASGVALITDLAAYYSLNPPAYSIAFIAFSAEEAGLIGSEYYTKNPLFPLENIRFLVNLDLMGHGDEGITVVNGSVFEREFELLHAINSKNNYLVKINRRGKAANSDHYHFSEKGVRSFFIYTLGGSKAYHDVHDIPANVKLPVYNEIFRLLTDFTGNLTGSPEKK